MGSEPCIEQQLASNSPQFTELEKSILQFTEQWTLKATVEPSVVKQLIQEFMPRELVILAATVAQANLTSRFNKTFGVELP
jgi:hypothetical protein